MTCALALSPQKTSGFSVEPWCRTKIDYSAANEYIEAHYGMGRVGVGESRHYFGAASKEEPVLDARYGVLDDFSETKKAATMESTGFTLVHAPTKTTEWSNVSHVRATYLPELEHIIRDNFKGSMISHVIFFNPMLRGEDLLPSRPDDSSISPSSSIALSTHIDADIGAYPDIEGVVNLIEKNRIDTGLFPRDELNQALKKGGRFAIVNAWRNIGSFPIERYPLALFATRYTGSKAFPDGVLDFLRSRWYTFPNMEQDELLLFRQYDRDVSHPSDLWHCALNVVGDANAPPRQSFDVRCFIVFDEDVPADRDRFGADRMRSLYSQKDSETFNSEQAKRRHQG
jgi:hypothetical protein